jgi:hypothetical protein
MRGLGNFIADDFWKSRNISLRGDLEELRKKLG